MRKNMVSRALRLFAGLAIAAVGTFSLGLSTVTPAAAQGVSAGCLALNAAFFNFNPVGPGAVGTRTETLGFNVGDLITIATSNLTAFLFQVDGVTVSTNPNGTVTYVIVKQGNNVLFKSVTGGVVTGAVIFTCTPAATPPTPPAPPEPPATPPAPPTPPGTTSSLLPISDLFPLNRNLEITELLIDQSRAEYCGGNPSRKEVGTVWTYGGAAEFQPINDSRSRGSYRRVIRAPYIQELFGANVLPGGPPDDELSAFDTNADGEADIVDVPPTGCTLVGEGTAGDPFTNIPYFPDTGVSAPSLEAISRYMSFDGTSMRGVVPLANAPAGWNVDVIVDAAIIDRSFAALAQRTLIGTVILNGRKQIDARTNFSAGIRVGQAVTTQAAGTLSATSAGLDFVLARLFSPTLFGAIYAGGEVASNHAVAGVVTGDYPSTILKIGGELDGRMALNAFTLTPSVSILFQYHSRPQFTDSVGVVVPALSALEANGNAALTLSREFAFLERELVMTPFVTGSLRVDAVATTPAVTGGLPVDPLRLSAAAGVRFLWDSGTSASVQADASRGATTTVLGWSGSVSVPLH